MLGFDLKVGADEVGGRTEVVECGAGHRGKDCVGEDPRPNQSKRDDGRESRSRPPRSWPHAGDPEGERDDKDH